MKYHAIQATVRGVFVERAKTSERPRASKFTSSAEIAKAPKQTEAFQATDKGDICFEEMPII